MASISIEDSFPEQGELVPEAEVDAFLKWFLECFRTDLTIAFTLGVHTAADYHGGLPNIHNSGRRPWRELEELVQGRLQPSYGQLDNLNCRS